MVGYRVVGAYRVEVASPVAHVHLVAIGTVIEGSSGAASTLAWAAAELDREQGRVEFKVGPPGATTPVSITHGPCAVCGEPTLRLHPHEVEQLLPECLVR